MTNRVTTVFDFKESGGGLKKIKADVAEVDGAWNKATVSAKGAWTEFKGSRAAQAAVAGMAIKIGVDAVNAASRLEESINAVNVTFDESAEGIRRLGEESVDSYGLSERAFNQMAVAFSGFATQIAGEGGDVVEVIDEMATRVADFASVHDLELSDAMTKFQSALAGETEAMRRYGIDVSAATVQTYAYEKGIADAGSTLTEQEKVLSRYGLLMESTAQWAGDFENTSDSLANTQRRLTANLENTQATLGEQLLPAATAVTDALNELAGAMDKVDGITLTLTDGQAGLGDVIGGAVSNILMGNQALGAAAEKLWEADDATRAYDESLSLTDEELQRSIDILNAQGKALDDTARSTEDLEQRQRDAAAAADMHRRKLRDLADQIGGLKKEIDDRQAWLRLQDTFADVTSQGINVANMSREQEMAVNDLKLEVLDYADSINLPERVVTEILADIDEGRLSEVESLLQRWGRGITIPIRPSVIATSGGSILTEGGRRVGARASGGPVSAGQTYLVGERGPELLTMGSNGYVTPNHALAGSAGGVTIGQIVVQAPAGANADDFGRAVREAIRRETRFSGPVTGWSAA